MTVIVSGCRPSPVLQRQRDAFVTLSEELIADAARARGQLIEALERLALRAEDDLRRCLLSEAASIVRGEGEGI